MLISWGSNIHGECCSGENAAKVEPKPSCVSEGIYRSIGHLRSVADVAAGESFTLLLTTGGNVFSCGRGKEGQLGVELPQGCRYSKQLILIEALRPWHISQIACGEVHGMAVSRCGRAFEWGLLLDKSENAGEDAFADGMQGLGRNFKEDLNDVQQKVVAESWSKYLLNQPMEDSPTGEDAVAFIKSMVCQRSPVPVPQLCSDIEDIQITSVSCGYGHSVVVSDTGAMLSCGYNEKGQLGNGTRMPSARFAATASPSGTETYQHVATVSCGSNHTAAIVEPGRRLVTWGLGTFGQLGLGHHKKESCKPSIVELRSSVLQVACGTNHTIAVLAGGEVFAFGHYDALGGTSHSARLPEFVKGLRPGSVKNVFAGGNGSFAVVNEDEVGLPHAIYAWGYNQRFQLGRYTGELELIRPGATRVPRLPGMNLRSFAAGPYHCVALLDAPTVPILPPNLENRCYGNAALWAMLDGTSEHDVFIRTADTDPVGAHHCILRLRCPALFARLTPSHGDPHKSSYRPRSWEVDLSAHRTAVIAALLEYIYGDCCRASPDVAAGLKALAEELSLTYLAESASKATETESSGSGIRWMKTASGKWAVVETDSVAPRQATASTYLQDLMGLVVDDSTDANYVRLYVKQPDGIDSKIVYVARPLLMTSEFFCALLDGGFAEARDFRSGSNEMEVSADNAAAFVTCLRCLAAGHAQPLMPECWNELLCIMIEAHRLGFTDAFESAALMLGNVVVEGDLQPEALETINRMATLFDLKCLARETEKPCKLAAEFSVN